MTIKTTGIKRSLLLFLTTILVLSQLNLASFTVFAAETDNEVISYEVQKDISSDKKKANLKIKTAPKDNKIEILTIETPDGKIVKGQEAEYTAEKNGSIDFLITYKEINSDKEAQTFTASYEVSGISTEKEVSPAEQEAPKQEQTSEPENETTKNTLKSLKTENSTVTLNIPDYDKKAWANGAIKDVTVTAVFNDDNSNDKKVNFTLPDGMRFVTIPVPTSYQAPKTVDAGILSTLSSGDPLGSAINSVTIPNKETNYNSGTYGTVSYNLDPGTERVTFTFSVRVDGAKYYGATDIKDPIKVETFMGEGDTPVATAEQSIHAEGKKVIGYAEQDSLQTMFRNYYTQKVLPEVLPSTDDVASYNYTKFYSVINGINQEDGRGARYFVPKNVTTTLYYPEGMEYVGVVNQSGSLISSSDKRTVTHYPEENKVVVDFNQMSYNGVADSVFAVKYKVPKGTNPGVYSAPKVPHAVMTAYDGTVFESDALSNIAADLTTLAPVDTCKVVDSTENKMTITTNGRNINPNNETWAGSVIVSNKATAGVKTNQIYDIKFDDNWQAYIVNLPCDGTISGNKVTDIQYKTNLNSEFRTYNGTLPKTNGNKMAQLHADAVGLKDGEYFTEVKANVGDFSVGFTNVEESGYFRSLSTASYGLVKPGIQSVQFKASIWDAEDEESTKVNGTSTYSVANISTSAANGTANFYNQDGAPTKTARAGDKITTKATLRLFDYPYGTRTVLSDPEIYLRQIEGSRIQPTSIKLTDQDGKDVDFTVTQETAKNGDKVYVLKTTDVLVGEFIGYPYKAQYLNISYDTSFDVTLNKSIHTDIQELLAWGGPNVTSALATNKFSDIGLDVNNNGKDNENLLSTNASALSVPKQDTVSVETFLNIAGEGEKSPYVEGDDSTVSYFTPGTDADYTVKVTNTSNDSARTFELYIPIPKTGQNFGSKFQPEAFKWDMKLNDAIQLTALQQEQFDVSYTTEANADNYDSSSIYQSSLSSYEKVNMVKIKVKTEIASGETQVFKIPLRVDETFESATTDNKISERDVYNPYYRVITNTYSGSLSGTRVGAELVIVELAGVLFEDKNVNGLYEESKGDKPLANETVELYKWNNSTSTYEPAKNNGENVTTKTNANGKYKFDYTLGVDYGNYAVKFPEKEGYQYTLQNIGKDGTIDSNPPNTGADKGWVKNIDPVQPSAQNINAGYFAYSPEQDLKVNLDNKLVQTGSSLTVTLPKVTSTSGEAAENTIEPEFFQNIQAKTDGYKWTTANTGIATVQTLSDGSGAIVGGSTNGKTLAATDLNVEIQDIFGTKKTSTAPVYVKTADGKVVQKNQFTLGATDFSIEYKDAQKLTETESLDLAKTAAFEEVKDGVNSSAQAVTVQADTTQLNAIQKGSKNGGIYPLTYKVNKDGKEAEVTIQVTVAKDLTTINAHDSTIYIGDNWTASDNFDSAVDKEGNPVAFKDVEVTGTVDTNTAGIYPVTYTYNGVSTTINVKVKAILTAVNAHDSTIYTTDSWTPADNFDSALDKDGNPVNLADITVTGSVNTKQPGNYNVTYSYKGASMTITVTVKENKEGINVHDSSIYVGEDWSREDNFDSAVDKDGNTIKFEDVKVTENPTVNVNKAGTYKITYSYDGISKTITLTIKEIKTAVNAHDSVVYLDEAWDAEDNFDSARDKDGNPVAFTDVQVSGTVDTSKAGTYPITYTYDNVSITVQVKVENPKTAVIAHDSIIYVGDDWSAKDNFDKAVDKAGNPVAFKDITVKESPEVNPNTPGEYTVTYSYEGVSTTILVTVKTRETTVKAHDSTIYAGEKWNAQDNFDGAKDKRGDKVSFADITVIGTVESKTPGTYEVSYLYDGVKAIAHITVLKNKAEIIVKDSIIKTSEKWSAKDNFVRATSRDGQSIPFSKVKVSGTVNTKKVGTYKVEYTIDPNEGTADAGKEQLTVTATVKVVEQNETPSKSSNSNSSSNLTISSNAQHSATYEESKAIPKTGDQSNPWIIWLGISLIGLGVLLWLNAQRKKKHE
ncbi:LPXTG cell wall anchor domain-containing protein [Listeria sp. FSL L7-0091]|uniref:bacterial Ig-like domain-containing protein n=1 Tax=Listeria farberi TaxID=2713500 RepID=UPI00162ADD7C|nr:bacterial Ig-like domain-containing protein [Listeria farberi]MBC2262681.1 LPXTG cell wall anchor domain-containing protein [Listeria farberi]